LEHNKAVLQNVKGAGARNRKDSIAESPGMRSITAENLLKKSKTNNDKIDLTAEKFLFKTDKH